MRRQVELVRRTPHLLLCWLCVALSASLAPRPALSALPPVSTGSQESSASTSAASAPPPLPGPDADDPGWLLPPVRVGGSVGFDWRQQSGDGGKVVSRGLIGTIDLSTETYIWEPWFARLGGNLSLTSSKGSSADSSASASGLDSAYRSLAINGGANLRILPGGRFPFSGYWSRNDSRITTQLLSVGGYVSERIGFEQRYVREGGESSLAFDHRTQESDSSGETKQDILQLRLSQHLEKQRIGAQASFERNKRINTGERTAQDNLSVQHTYNPAQTTTIETAFNTSRSDFRLAGASTDTQLVQASSMVFWRPEAKPLTVTAGLRLLGLGATTVQEQASPADSRVRNANLNLGVQYELSRNMRAVATANVNTTENNGRSTVTSGETAALHYSSPVRKIGAFDYSWDTGASAAHQRAPGTSSSQLNLQLSHRLSRSFPIDESTSVSADVSQSVSVTAGGTRVEGAPGGTRYLTHGGSIAWQKSHEGSYSVVRFSVSDNRALDGGREYFQMFNLQASSNLPTGANTSWTGSLTLQGIRQGSALPSTGFVPRTAKGSGFVTTSSGSITYANRRAFGLRGLRFTSDLRLNSEALLPLLGGPEDQELTAWENRLDYSIGRLNLRLAALISANKTPVRSAATGLLVREDRSYRSIMFSVTRTFGD